MNKKQIAKIVYIVLFVLVLVIPGIGTFIWKQEAMGNEEAVDFKDMNYNNAADKIDDYFSVKFGFISVCTEKQPFSPRGRSAHLFTDGFKRHSWIGFDDDFIVDVHHH